MASGGNLSAARCRTAGPGKLSDGGGLFLVKQASGSAQWVFRYQMSGRRREMGLGPFPLVTLAEAREARDKWAKVKALGADPIAERDRERRLAAAGLTFAQAAEEAFEAIKPELRDDGVAGRWFSPLRLHVLPRLGKLAAAEVDAEAIRAALAPIWRKHPVTAQKALRRIRRVLRWAAAADPAVDLQAPDKAAILLGDPGHTERHIPAMDWQDVSTFYASLNDGTPAHLALRLMILTAQRTRPIRYAHADQFDLDAAVWTIPAEGEGARMKGRKGKVAEFRVPLSCEALGVIQEALKQARQGWLFPGKSKGVLSDATLSRLMERRRLDARPHGFRASFRTWAEGRADETLTEMALGHVAGSKVVRAYRRTDRLEERRALAERWAGVLAGDESGGGVVRLVAGVR